MTDRLPIPGPRDVTASLDTSDASRVVVACPPHPQMGGDRRDSRLRAVADALAGVDCACLRFDYGPWDEGRAEVTDVRSALAWAHDNFLTVGLFGYSFGGSMALLAAAAFREGEDAPGAVSVLSPASTVHGRDVMPAVDDVACPLEVRYGERDDTVDSLPIAERARDRGDTVTALPADHFFAGQQQAIAADVASFFDSSF
ncbi:MULTISPECIES: alpha/beta hydrolase [Salinibaculum]|uniref:alpha/beta hydrolase n=1 Tax=Salinibaculum TaxID=2732368 RepID=UPI0030D61AD4